MSRQAQIAVLATAALAALAVAGVRIAHAVHRPTERSFHVPVRGSTPSAEAATLAAMRAPSGYRRFHPCALGDCYVLRRSLPLDVGTMRRLAGAFGVKTAGRFVKSPPIECGELAGRDLCKAEGLVGRESVEVSMQRPEVRNPEPRTRRNRQTYERFVVIPGTEVEVSVIGHCLHPKECAEMAHMEETEARHGT